MNENRVEPGLDQEQEASIKAVEQDKPVLLTLDDEKVAKFVRSRWDRHEAVWKRKRAELRVLYLRFKGITVAQVDSRDPTRVWLPSLRGSNMKSLPDLNHIETGVHRMVAQIVADEPVMEAVPRNSTDEDRDAAEAATFALQGETERMRLVHKLRLVMEKACIFRSGYWLMSWDDFDGPEEEAQVYNEDGELTPHPSGKKVRQGNLKCDVLNPLHVRYSGASYAHDADEVIVGDLISLRKAIQLYDKLNGAEVRDVIAGVPEKAQMFLRDDQEVTFRDDADEEEEVLQSTCAAMDESEHSMWLDRKVFLLRYYRKPDKQYPEGLEVHTVGKITTYREKLRWGLIPIAQFKFLFAEDDELGVGLVDMLKDPQELISFVHGQILRFLQTLRRRWFVPQGSQISPQALLNPTQAVIQYNPAAGEPKPEIAPEIPNSLLTYLTQFEANFNDTLGIHETMQGKHVPGVSSGRHAEALRSGDETLLGLTRSEIEVGLRAAYMTILAAIKEEWTLERRVRMWGEDRAYIDKSFRSTDFGETSEVLLKKGTLLMLTPAQKTETIYGFMQLGLLDEVEARKLSPLTDTAGISLSEDPHYQEARRDIERFNAGPPPEAYDLQDQIVAAMASVEGVVEQAAMNPALAQVAEQMIGQVEELTALFEADYGWVLEHWQQAPRTATVHFREKSAALSRSKAETFPRWWIDLFAQHVVEAGMYAGQIQPPAQPGAPMEASAEELPAPDMSGAGALPTGSPEQLLGIPGQAGGSPFAG
jgi:hypothetical protein